MIGGWGIELKHVSTFVCQIMYYVHNRDAPVDEPVIGIDLT